MIFNEFLLVITRFVFSGAFEAFPYTKKLFETNAPGFSQKDGVDDNVFLLNKCIIREPFYIRDSVCRLVNYIMEENLLQGLAT
jgi:hypothetical protein